MAGPWLFCLLVGSSTALLLTVPKSPIYISAGNTALLSASLNFSTLLPDYFQLRWHFVTGSCLVLLLKADSCLAETAPRNWRDSCEISIEKTERYSFRAKLSSEDASLVLQDVRVEDSGIYSITMLALGVRLLANINLTVTNESSVSNHQTENSSSRPVLPLPSKARSPAGEEEEHLLPRQVQVNSEVHIASVKAVNDHRVDYMVSNIIRLSLAGLVLCLLGLMIAKAQ
ncbi:uncharacterized protein LOC128342871 isoform X2 [Hemicordylus capensis]|uniref:uncharacterized protein LOC128342871 isoform X2 n=1 Tax=Hemicordylus capensis TaxID=884348 RepID=UPI0023034A2C|nr:uncharacterized protein LOC128342871 isoform X2 [Hemicordylus capensis]